MKVSKLIMAMIVVATIGFLVWAHFAAYRIEDKPAAAEQPTISATATTATALLSADAAIPLRHAQSPGVVGTRATQG